MIHLIVSLGILFFLILAKNNISQTGKFRWDRCLWEAVFAV